PKPAATPPPPPPNKPAPETSEPAKPVFGVTEESTVEDSDFAVRVGNTLMKKQEDQFTDPNAVKPYAPPRPTPIKVTRPPKLRRMVEPEYPALARRSGVEGRVVLKVFISASGNVTSAEVAKAEPSGMGFEQAAISAVRQWTYEAPGNDVWCYQPIRFRLDG
ncbi:TonB family protein, partial [bacterium]|nr:TonB family protein [bacterium]